MPRAASRSAAPERHGRARWRAGTLALTRLVSTAVVSTAGIALAPAAATQPAAPPAAPGAAVPLPSPRVDGAVALERTLAQRRSLRSFAPRALALADAGQLLWAAQGVSDAAQQRRTAPSAGATYPLELVLVAGRVDGLRPGAHRYEPASHRLTAVAAGDLRAAIAAAARDQRWLADAPALVVIAAQPARTAARYGARADRYLAIEAGAAAQNLLLQAVALGLGGTLVGAFDEAALKRVVPLGDGEQPLAIVAVGYPR
jgi:SagB-type dehydrogenase family enzyme